MKQLFLLVTSACCLVTPIQYGSAQTVFAWPDAKVNLSGYHYLDNCVAAGARVWDSIRSVQAILPDTVFYARGQLGEAPPTKTQTSLRECLSHFTPTQIPREYALLAQQAYLYAGLFAEADAVVHHGFSQIATTDTASRAALLDSAIQRLTTSPPYQLSFVKTYIDTLERYGAAYRPWNLFRNYFWLMHAAYVGGEDSLAVRAGGRVFDLAPSAAKGANTQELFTIGIGVSFATRIVRGKEVLDSLRKGTAAYATLYSTLYRKTMGFVPPVETRDVEAPVLVGDYWFPSTAATQEYPRKGRVSLVAFVPDWMNGGASRLTLSKLRRLTQKYPMVDLVLVTSTEGNFSQIEPPPPEREAFLADSVIRHGHHLNPVLTVTKGSYVQFDAPDNRRFYQPYPNLDAYPPTGSGKNLSIYLIDTDGRIVDLLNNTVEEGWVMQLVETLLARTVGGQH